MSIEQVTTSELPNHKCMIPGCENMTLGRLCNDHWFKLPLPLRGKWWKETNYGKLTPSPELVEEIRQTVKQQAQKVANEGDADQRSASDGPAA